MRYCSGSCSHYCWIQWPERPSLFYCTQLLGFIVGWLRLCAFGDIGRRWSVRNQHAASLPKSATYQRFVRGHMVLRSARFRTFDCDSLNLHLHKEEESINRVLPSRPRETPQNSLHRILHFCSVSWNLNLQSGRRVWELYLPDDGILHLFCRRSSHFADVAKHSLDCGVLKQAWRSPWRQLRQVVPSLLLLDRVYFLYCNPDPDRGPSSCLSVLLELLGNF